MSRKRPGWRAAERTYRSIGRALAREAAESVKREREVLAATVCPDGATCGDSLCIEARAAIMRGAGWREAVAILYPVRNASGARADCAVPTGDPGKPEK
jgi:hypothetical protein